MGRAYQNRKVAMAKTAEQNTRVYSRYSREVYMAAKVGGTDPQGNLTLRGLLERAKKDQVPTHVTEKAIKRAEGSGGEDYFPAVYEGFGPGGCMVIVDCLTDNPNRTIGDVRLCFTKTKCKLGTPGSVSHMFDHAAIFRFAGSSDEAVLEALLAADVDVIDIESADGAITVFAPNTEYGKARQALADSIADIDFEVDEIQYLPKGATRVSGDDVAMFEKFMGMLDALDDVQRVYHDADIV